MDCWAEIRSQHPQEPAVLQQPLERLFTPSEHSYSTGALFRMATSEISDSAEELEASMRSIRMLSSTLEDTIEQARNQVGRHAWLHLVSTWAGARDLTLQ
jgi:hypothetical protein